MKFRNVKVPGGINVSKHSPLADLFILSAGAVALFGAIGLIALVVGSYAGRYMPMSWENAMAAAVFDAGEAGEPAAESGPAEAALQDLANRLSAQMALPEGLVITAHYMDDGQLNAFATLGGHVFIFRGLVERVPNENALAMVMAHEIAHAGNRDVAANLGGALLMQLVLGIVVGSSPETTEGLIYGTNGLLLRRFSRDAERAADRDGLAAVAAEYGHVAGADAFFRILLEEIGGTLPAEGPEFLSTHPLTAGRIADMRALAEERGWALEGERTALGEDLEELDGEP